MPSYPTFNRNPLDLADDAEAAGADARRSTWSTSCSAGRLRFAVEDPDAPENLPRVLTVWRANLLGSSGKGNEYFLKHLLGTDNCGPRRRRRPEDARPRDVTWRDEAPEGKLDLLLSLDFRMTSTDAVQRRRAAGGHLVREARPVHAPTCTRSSTRSTRRSTRRGRPAATTTPSTPSAARVLASSRAAHLGVRKDLVAVPLLHDTPDEMAVPGGRRRATGETGEVRRRSPGVTMPKLVVVERDYAAIGAKMAALGPLVEQLGTTTKGVTFDAEPRRSSYLRRDQRRHPRRSRRRAGRRSSPTSRPARRSSRCPARPTAGSRSQGFRTLEKRTGQQLADLAAEHEGKRITFADTQARPGAGHHRPRVVRHASTAGGATRRSPSTSSGSSRGTPSPAASTSSSTTTG